MTISVYNLIGERVATLVNESKNPDIILRIGIAK